MSKRSLSSPSISKRIDGPRRLRPGDKIAVSRKFILILLAVLWAVASLAADKDMLGILTREQIIQGCPGWDAVAAAYVPAPDPVAKLKEFARPVQVEVFLGSWCSDSKLQVPAFFKVLDAVGSPLISVTYIGVPHDKDARPDYYGGKDIQRIPTFIVSVDGLEKGRIIESPVKSIEQDLVDILSR